MTIFLSLIISFLITTAVTSISLGVIRKMGLLDDPKKHKHPGIIHKKIVPRGGGIPFFLGIVLTAAFFLPLTKTVIALFIAGFIALLIGVLDDKYDISPYVRFIGNIAVALIV